MAKITAAKRDEIEKRAAQKFGAAAVEQARQHQQQAVKDANQEYLALKARQTAQNAKLTRDEKVQRGLRSTGSTVAAQETAPAASLAASKPVAQTTPVKSPFDTQLSAPASQQTSGPAAPQWQQAQLQGIADSNNQRAKKSLKESAQYVGETADKSFKAGLEALFNDFIDTSATTPVQSYMDLSQAPKSVREQILNGMTEEEYYAQREAELEQWGRDTRSTKYADEAAAVNEKYGVDARSGLGVLGSVVGSGAQMAPSLAAGAVNPALGYMTTFSMGRSGGVTEALENGASYDVARAAGTISGAIEAGIEMASGGIGGTGIGAFKGLGKEAAEEIAKEVVEESTSALARKLFKDRGAQVLFTWAQNSLGEGLEEFVTTELQAPIKLLYDEAASTGKPAADILREMKAALPDAVYSALVGSITGAVMGSPNALRAGNPTKVQTQIANELVRSGVMTKAEAFTNGKPSDVVVQLYETAVKGEQIKAQAEAAQATEAAQTAETEAAAQQPAEQETAQQETAQPAQSETAYTPEEQAQLETLLPESAPDYVRRADVMGNLTAGDMQAQLKNGSGEDAVASIMEMLTAQPKQTDAARVGEYVDRAAIAKRLADMEQGSGADVYNAALGMLNEPVDVNSMALEEMIRQQDAEAEAKKATDEARQQEVQELAEAINPDAAVFRAPDVVANIDGTDIIRSVLDADEVAYDVKNAAEAFNRKVVIVKSLPRNANAAWYNGTIYMAESVFDPNAKRGPLSTLLFHEITHSLRGAKAWEKFKAYALQQLEARPDIREEVETLYRPDEWEEEYVAHYVEQVLFQDQEAVNALARAQRSTAQRILESLKSLAKGFGKKATAEQRAILKAERMFAQALAETKNPATDGRARNAINPNFANQYDAWDKRDKNGYFVIGTTSEPLQSIGIDPGKIRFYKQKILNILNNPEHNVTDNEIKQLPQMLENPVMVMQSLTNLNRVVVAGELYVTDANGNVQPVIAALELRPNGKVTGFSVIASAYDRNLQGLVNNSDILYLDPNKKRTDSWLQFLRLQLPANVTQYGSIGKVTYSSEVVNSANEPSIMQHKLQAAGLVDENGKAKFSLPDTDSQYMAAVESGDMETAQRMVKEAAGYNEAGHHGTRRGDRVGNVFLPERATSGPFAYFTDNREIAENYSRDKADTSTAYDERYDNYHTQFRVQTADGDAAIEDIWYKLPLKDRNEIARRAAEVTFDDDWENIVSVSGNKRGTGGFEQNLKEARGNALKALVTEWLDSGTLYGDEARFNEVLDVSGINDILERAGYGKVEYFDPDATFERVYDVYMRAQNPFDTQQVDEAFVEDFMRWYSAQDADAYARESANADSWDKNNITAEQFAEKMRDDIANDRTNAWTSIPDSMSDYLRSQGFDIIKDAGGKQGGTGHTVWIPLGDSNSVKSSDPVTYDDNGNVIPLSQRFNPESRDIRYSLPSNQPSARGNINLREAAEQRWRRSRIKQGSDWLVQHLVSGQKPLENLSKDAEALVDAARRTGGVTQYIAEEQLVSPDGDIMGAPSYVEMFVEAVPQEQRESFDDYRKHLHNIDRMSLENDMELTAAVDEYNAFINEHPEYENFNDGYLKRIAKEGGDGNLAERFLALRDMVETLKAEKNKPVMAHEVDGKMVPYTAEESAEIVAEYDAQHPEWADIVAEQNAWWDTFNQMWLVETGLVSPQAYAALREKYPNYMPTYRVDGKKGGMSSFGNRFTHNAIKQAKGSTAEVLPYYQQYIEQIERVIKMQRRNEIGQYLVEYAMQNPRVAARQGIAITQDAGDITDIVNNEGDLNEVEKAGLKALDNGTYQFSVKVNGENVTLNLSKEMYDAIDWLNSNGYGDTMNVAVKLGRKLMRFSKDAITTYNPLFIIKNFFRDLQTYMTNNNAPVGRAAKYYAKAAAEIARNGEAYQQLKALGGLGEGYYSTDKAYALPDDSALGKAKKVAGAPLRAIAAGSEFVESIPRMAEYMALRDKYGNTPEGRRKAALGASDVTTNFARTAPGSKILNAFVMYWNAGVQGVDKTVRQLKSAPLRTLAKAAGMQTLLSALLAWAVKDNPYYDELDDEVKDNYFLIPNILGEQDKRGFSKTFIRLPRSREYGPLLGASVARIIDGLNDKDLGGDDSFEEFSEWLGSVSAGFMPPDIMGNNIFNTFTRMDLFDPASPGETWYGGDIVPYRLQKYAPNEQYDVGTSGLARETAHALNKVNDRLPLYPDLSPEKLDDLFDTYGGIWADIAMGLTSPKNKGATAGETVGNALLRGVVDPWVKGFTSDPRYSSGAVDEFYNFLNEAELAAADRNKREGIPSQLRTPEEIAISELNDLSAELSELYAEERAVYAAPGSAAEKNKRSKEIREEINKKVRNFEMLYNWAYASANNDWAEAERVMPLADIYSLAADIDADGNGYWKNDERQAVIDRAYGLTDDEKSYLWLFFGGSDKSNPYD